MAQKIQGVTTDQPFPFHVKGIIQDPQLGIVTEAYPVGEREYSILTHRYWIDWLKPFAYASLTIFLGGIYNLLAFVYQIYTSSPEEVIRLKESQGDEIYRSTTILIFSGIVFVILMLINKIVPTQKKSLLKDIRQILDRKKTIIAKKQEESTRD